MKKTLLTFGVLVAVLCGTLVYAANGRGTMMNVAEAASSTTPSEEGNPTFGVSIGTVEAQLYSKSGLNFDYFDRAIYVAKTSEGTYMGFYPYSEHVYDEETGEESEVEAMAFVAINSTEEAVTIPDSISVGEKTYPIVQITEHLSELRNGFNSGIKILTIPSTVNHIGNYNSSFDQYLDAIYMLGAAPHMSSSFQVSTIYVCDKKHIVSYLNNENFPSPTIFPYGWDYEWITVNVEKNGEFAECFLTQNNYDWGAAQYLKVTGNINDTDLSAIKNLTALLKLDLSGTTITSLPEQFMRERSILLEVKLPSTLDSIGSSAFAGCSALQSFDLKGIKTISSSAFSGCSSLSYINLSGVLTIDIYAFKDCSKLNNIDLSSVVNIGRNAFENCTSLESIDLTSAISIGDNPYYGDGASFRNCTSLKNIIFGNNLTKIYGQVFRNTAVESIKLPESITSLSDGVFSECSKLTSVELPSSLTNIGESTFRNCSKLTSIELPSSITTIGSGAFSRCSSLSQVIMKSGLLTIEERAFANCTSLQDITIPATVKFIGSGAFNYTGITNFKCYAVVPPSATGSFIGEGMDMTRSYLYVPPFSKDFYRNTQYWLDFYLMRSIEEPIDYIYVDRPLTINLEEEDNAVVANDPSIVLDGNDSNVGQLTATGEGTLSAGQMTVNATLASRFHSWYQYCPTLINYADKMRADNLTINMSLYNRWDSGEWHFISLPYDVKVSDIIPSDNTYWVIRRYDSAARAAGETDATWVNLTNDDTMEAGKGYIISASGGEIYPRLSFTSGNSLTKNNLFRSTDIIVPLTEYAAEFAHNRSWNLIGNPYPCYFDMHYLNEEFTAPITVWNGESYIAYSPVDDDLVLSPYEAFFVQCPLNATEMIFKEGGRMHSEAGRSLYRSPAMTRATVSAEERNVFNFEVSKGDFSDRARIVMNPDASIDYEIGRDASKFFADKSDCAQIYVAADVNYSISERPVLDGSATLGVRTSKEGVYTLSLSGNYSSEWNVILTDNATGISVDLTKDNYQFTAADGDSDRRFSVMFQIGAMSGIESVISDFGNDADVTVTAINGVTVYTGRLSGMNVPAAGIYIISNGKETRKAILK